MLFNVTVNCIIFYELIFQIALEFQAFCNFKEVRLIKFVLAHLQGISPVFIPELLLEKNSFIHSLASRNLGKS